MLKEFKRLWALYVITFVAFFLIMEAFIEEGFFFWVFTVLLLLLCILAWLTYFVQVFAWNGGVCNRNKKPWVLESSVKDSVRAYSAGTQKIVIFFRVVDKDYFKDNCFGGYKK